MTDKDIFQEAIIKWGVPSQLDMLVEECAELIQAVNKFKRHFFKDGVALDNLSEEIADVEIMIGQMKIWMGEKKINQYRESKIKRLKQRLDGTDTKDNGRIPPR